jgi:hypothetical protein
MVKAKPVPKTVRKPKQPKQPKQKGSFEVVAVPQELRERLGPGRGFDSGALDRAEAAVMDLQPEYEARVRQDVKDFDAAFATMRSTGVFDVSDLHARACRIRSEGGSYDYPLLTDFADSLADYLGNSEDLDGAGINIVETHLSALAVVAENHVRGAGGETAKEPGKSLRGTGAAAA